RGRLQQRAPPRERILDPLLAHGDRLADELILAIHVLSAAIRLVKVLAVPGQVPPVQAGVLHPDGTRDPGDSNDADENQTAQPERADCHDFSSRHSRTGLLRWTASGLDVGPWNAHGLAALRTLDLLAAQMRLRFEVLATPGTFGGHERGSAWGLARYIPGRN